MFLMANHEFNDILQVQSIGSIGSLVKSAKI